MLPLLLFTLACHPVDRYTTGRLIHRAAAVPDVGEACAMGAALSHLLDAQGRPGRPPHQALVVSETTAALCDEALAWDAELEALRLQTHHADGDTLWALEAKDASLVAGRAHAAAAARYFRAWNHLSDAFGPPGAGSCPKLDDREQLVYVLGLFAGLNGLLHDRAAGGVVGIPMDLPPQVARAAACLDDATWWSVPGAYQAAAWATVPGSGPDGVDPWDKLEKQASAGEASGVRLGRALQAMVLANAGRDEETGRVFVAQAAALAKTPSNPDWALLDAYATQVSLYLSDRLWITARGYRTPVFGTLPNGVAPKPDPSYMADPFATEETHP